jgi:hypothetical protein
MGGPSKEEQWGVKMKFPEVVCGRIPSGYGFFLTNKESVN